MGRVELEELTRRRRSQIPLLAELGELTQQLKQAMERRDEVSVQMMMNLREDPLRALQEIEGGIWSYVMRLPEQDAIRCRGLLTGETAPESPEEEALSAQSASCRRTLDKLIQADKQISLRLCGDRSIYKMFRE